MSRLLVLLVLLLAWIPALEAAPRHGAPAAPARDKRFQDDAAAPVNVNTANMATLVTLKGVGEKKARAIMTFRKSHGPFRSLADFEAVPGIGPALIERNRARIVFGGS